MSKEIQQKLEQFAINKEVVSVSNGFNTHNGVITADYSNAPRWGYYPTMYNISTLRGTLRFFSNCVIDVNDKRIMVTEIG